MSLIDTKFNGDRQAAQARLEELRQILSEHEDLPCNAEDDRLESEKVILYYLLDRPVSYPEYWQNVTIDDVVDPKYKNEKTL